VGYYVDSTGISHGFLRHRGNITTIDGPKGAKDTASGINAQGEIVGVYYDSTGTSHGFLRHRGTFTTIDGH
jgi:probable HAF family extracellular repeat protein